MTATSDMLKRLPYQFQGLTNWEKLITILGDKWQEFYDVMGEIEVVFDLETAEGEQLDMIGERLNWPRSGFADTEYRKILKAIANTVLPFRGTTPILFKITRALLDPGLDPIQYQEFYPAAYMMTLTNPDPVMVEVWKVLIKYGKPAGVGMHVVLAPEDAFQYDDDILSVTATDTEYGDETDPNIGGQYSDNFVI